MLIGFIFFSIYFVNEKRNDKVIFEKHFKKELKRTNYPEVNILLYNYFKNKNLSDINMIMYDWDFTQLPKFKNSQNLSCQTDSIDYLKKNYKKNIYYLIKINACSTDFMDYFYSLENKKIIFQHNDHILWKNK